MNEQHYTVLKFWEPDPEMEGYFFGSIPGEGAVLRASEDNYPFTNVYASPEEAGAALATQIFVEEAKSKIENYNHVKQSIANGKISKLISGLVRDPKLGDLSADFELADRVELNFRCSVDDASRFVHGQELEAISDIESDHFVYAFDNAIRGIRNRQYPWLQ